MLVLCLMRLPPATPCEGWLPRLARQQCVVSFLPRAHTSGHESHRMLWCAKWRGRCFFVLVRAHLMQRRSFGACGAQVAGLLLKKYKERFATAPVAATYRYLRQWAADSLPANPLVRPGCCFCAWMRHAGMSTRPCEAATRLVRLTRLTVSRKP